MSSSSNSKGESHRIYWQQWVSSKNGTSSKHHNYQTGMEHKSRRELITSSAAVRISHTGARAKDVTDLLRSTLQLGNADKEGLSPYHTAADHQDSLVLVGTLYSLPRYHVQFRHELLEGSAETSSSAAAAVVVNTSSSVAVPSTYSNSSSTSSKSDPYHVVKTLRPTDDPLKVRRRMEDHLTKLQQAAPVSRTIISPKLQWFYVPAPNETNSLIPNCVELDGYCTSLEEDEEESSDEDENDEPDDQEGEAFLVDDFLVENNVDDMLRSQFPWLCTEDDSSTTQLPADIDQRRTAGAVDQSALSCRVRKEESRSRKLSKQQSVMLKSQCLSGYLWKRSRKDPHVWRKSYCVLTDDYLWSVSRIYEAGDERYSKHSCIRLTRALLLEPSVDYVPLYRTPFAFELVTGKGLSYVFRASNKAMQTRWIQALSSRIVQSFENSLIDHAELIVADECLARNRRLAQHAVDPFVEALKRQQEEQTEEKKQHEEETETTDTEKLVVDARIRTLLASSGPLGVVLRWGMQVAAYRECCRHIQSILPAKNPVVASSSPQRRPSDPALSSEPIDPAVQCMIQAAWTRAAELLARATHVATRIQPKLSRSVETQCRHVDYIIHGRFRSNGGGDGVAGEHHDPPPMDLLDALLAELQALAARVHCGSSSSSSSSSSSRPRNGGNVEH